jgi:serine/threonine protein kinase
MIGTQISHYRLEAKLGEGTYGAVYRGVHIHDAELQVAVKVVHPNLANDEAFVIGLWKEVPAG